MDTSLRDQVKNVSLAHELTRSSSPHGAFEHLFPIRIRIHQ